MNLIKRISILAVAAVIILSLPQLAAAEEHRDTITLSGTAQTDVEPDMATLNINLEGTAETAAAAREITAEKLQELKNVLLGETITSDNVSTTSYNLEPVYEIVDHKRKLTGYTASSTIEIKITDLQRLGAVIDKCVNKSGGTVDSVQFGLQDPGLIERKLLGTATENAAEKARIIANAGGRNLGALVDASVDGDVGAARVMNAKNMSMATADVAELKMSATELMPGTINISVTVNTVFSLA